MLYIQVSLWLGVLICPLSSKQPSSAHRFSGLSQALVQFLADETDQIFDSFLEISCARKLLGMWRKRDRSAINSIPSLCCVVCLASKTWAQLPAIVASSGRHMAPMHKFLEGAHRSSRGFQIKHCMNKCTSGVWVASKMLLSHQASCALNASCLGCLGWEEAASLQGSPLAAYPLPNKRVKNHVKQVFAQ
jgi:hypothetical protein